MPRPVVPDKLRFVRDSLTVGDTPIGTRYVLKELLGEGGMGTVYKAVDSWRCDAPVAIKILDISAVCGTREATDALKLQTFQGEPTSLHLDSFLRFRREIDLMAAVEHRNLVRILDAIDEPDEVRIVMEFLAGRSLGRRLEAGPLPLGLVQSFMEQTLDALSEVHLKDIVHSDVKPENLLLTADGGTIKLADFGIATLMQGISQENLRRGMTVAYTAPEQLGHFGGALDQRTDLYSLGLCCYEMLTGHFPFEKSEFGRLEADKLSCSYPPVESLRRGVPAHLLDIVGGMMSPNPVERPSEAAEVLAGLRCGQKLSVSSKKIMRRVLRAPHVGRQMAMNRLHQALATARTKGVVTWVGGPTGVGKSRLVGEFNTMAVAQDVRIAAGRCTHVGRLTPFYGLITAVSTYMADWAAESGLERIEERRRLATLEEIAKELAAASPGLRKLVRFPSEKPEKPRVWDAHARFEHLCVWLCKALRAAGDPAVLLVLDDMQWADGETLNFVERLQRQPEPGILALLSYRSEDCVEDHPLFRITAEANDDSVISLKPLSEAETVELLGCLLGENLLDFQGFQQAIYAATGGIPFFIESFALGLVRHQAIVDQGDRREFDGDRMHAVLAEVSSGGLVAGRVATLPGKELDFLRAASVLGEFFGLVPLSRVVDCKPAETLDALEVAVNANLIARVDNGRYRFVHAKIREYVYDSLDRYRRTVLHKMAGESLERTEHPDVYGLAEHFFRANEARKALHYNYGAACTAAESYANPTALALFERCQLIHREYPELTGVISESTVLSDCAAVLNRVGRFAHAWEMYDRALQSTPSKTEKVALLCSMGDVEVSRLRPASALQLFEAAARLDGALLPMGTFGVVRTIAVEATRQLLRALTGHRLLRLSQPNQVPAQRARIRALYRAWSAAFATSPLRAMAWHLRALTMADEVPETPEAGLQFAGYAVALRNLALTRLGDEYSDRAVQVARSSQDVWCSVRIHFLVAFGAFSIGKWEKAIEYLNVALDFFSRTEDATMLGLIYGIRGSCFLQQGRIADGRRDAMRNLRIARDYGSLGGLVDGPLVLAACAVLMNDRVTALKHVQEATENYDPAIGDLYTALFHREKAAVLAHFGLWDTAREEAERGVQIVVENRLSGYVAAGCHAVLLQAYLADPSWSASLNPRARRALFRRMSGCIRRTRLEAYAFPSMLPIHARSEALLLFRRGRTVAAKRRFEESVEIARSLGHHREAMRSLALYADVLEELGDVAASAIRRQFLQEPYADAIYNNSADDAYDTKRGATTEV